MFKSWRKKPSPVVLFYLSGRSGGGLLAFLLPFHTFSEQFESAGPLFKSAGALFECAGTLFESAGALLPTQGGFEGTQRAVLAIPWQAPQQRKANLNCPDMAP